MSLGAAIQLMLNVFQSGQGAPTRVLFDQGLTFAEGTPYSFDIASDGGAYTLPLIGAGQGDLVTVQLFAVIVDQTVTLTWASGVHVLEGTTALPALALFVHCSSTSVPTITNASGETAHVTVVVAGASA